MKNPARLIRRRGCETVLIRTRYGVLPTTTTTRTTTTAAVCTVSRSVCSNVVRVMVFLSTLFSIVFTSYLYLKKHNLYKLTTDFFALFLITL